MEFLGGFSDGGAKVRSAFLTRFGWGGEFGEGGGSGFGGWIEDSEAGPDVNVVSEGVVCS
jgi:hypothetical protein